MTDSTTSPSRTSSDKGVASLETSLGTTTIAEGVVGKIASMATREIDGVESMGGPLSGALSNVVSRIRGEEHTTPGVGVEVGTREAAVDLSLTVGYPTSIQNVAEAVRKNVIDRIQTMTGLKVVEVNIAVTDLAFAQGEEPAGRVE